VFAFIASAVVIDNFISWLAVLSAVMITPIESCVGSPTHRDVGFLATDRHRRA
jgi:hypothetical protein